MARSSGTYEKLNDADEYCRPPGWWGRRKAGVRWGAIWRCDCGYRYRWEGHWALYATDLGDRVLGPKMRTGGQRCP